MLIHRLRLTKPAVLAVSIFTLSSLIPGCGGGRRAVRGDDEPGLDHAAMSTSLDRRDLQKALNENMQIMRNSAIVQRWMGENRPPVAVLPMRNETSEHIDSALQALITDVETQLINWGAVRVISLENQQQMMAEIRRQYSDGFDQTQIAHWGKQIGARYFIDGKVFSTDERVGDQRRVQYYMFVRAMSVETGEVLFQNKVAITKAIIRD
ncbi:MAG: penicillin-binding protein activator LpoB [Myxococcales bacterium]|nr:penicillin-binding protein activator LpoB [Myxococcales bacterium]MDD9964943.1 penicillin-binding protein activator LpoB [Myxococcales bacterium]